MMHVLVHGPQGCGKTRNKVALAKSLNCGAIVDGVTLAEVKQLADTTTVKTLFLTYEDPCNAVVRRVETMPFDIAMRKAGLRA